MFVCDGGRSGFCVWKIDPEVVLTQQRPHLRITFFIFRHARPSLVRCPSPSALVMCTHSSHRLHIFLHWSWHQFPVLTVLLRTCRARIREAASSKAAVTWRRLARRQGAWPLASPPVWVSFLPVSPPVHSLLPSSNIPIVIYFQCNFECYPRTQQTIDLEGGRWRLAEMSRPALSFLPVDRSNLGIHRAKQRSCLSVVFFNNL